MRKALLEAARIVCAPLWPVAVLQAIRVRRTTPRLLGAAGVPCGEIPGNGEVCRVLAVGESTVAGVGAPTYQEALTSQIAAACARRTGRPVRWAARGRIGLTTESALRRRMAETDTKFDVVVLVFGINDVLTGTRPIRWSHAVESLIAAVRRTAGHVPVVLAGVPPAGKIQALPQPLRLLLGLRAARLDHGLAQLTREVPDVVHVPTRLPGGAEYFSGDRLHPSPLGYHEWGELLARHVVAVSGGR